MFFRKLFIIDYQLPYPSGAATGRYASICCSRSVRLYLRNLSVTSTSRLTSLDFHSGTLINGFFSSKGETKAKRQMKALLR